MSAINLSIISIVISLASFFIALFALLINFLSHRRNNIPEAKGNYSILKDEENDMIKMLKKNGNIPSKSSSGYYLLLTISNTRKSIVHIKVLVDKKNKVITPLYDSEKNRFGWILKEGDSETRIMDVSRDGLSILKKSKKIYALDTSDKKHILEKNKDSQKIPN